MSKTKNIQWDTIGKVGIMIVVLAVAFFFPFQKYLMPDPDAKNIQEKGTELDMMTALLEKEEERDYTTDPQIYWRRDGKGYLLYVNGKQIAGTKSSWSGDDLLVHDPKKDVTYALKNFKNLKDSQLREGEIRQKE